MRTNATGQQRLALADDYVRLEVAAALARSGVRLIPVFVQGATMPPAEQLPEDLRGLTRLQGLSLRDDTWDADVDRVVASIGKTLGSSAIAAAAKTKVARGRPRWLIPGAAVIAIVELAYAASDYFGDRRSAVTAPATVPPSNAPPVTVEAHAIALPRMVEAVAGYRIYTVLSASIAPHGAMTPVRFRVRVSNEGSEEARVWSSDFRLEVRGSRLSATTDVSETVSGQFDGKETPALGRLKGSKITTIFNKAKANSFEVTNRVDGKAMSTEIYSVSADGKTLDGTPTNAPTEKYKVVFDRQ